MELALNLVWLAVVAALLITRAACPPARDQRRDHVSWVMALVCVMALLFPAISITDDLNSGPALLSARNLKKGLLSDLTAKEAPAAAPVIAPLQQEARHSANPDSSACLQLREFFSTNSSRRPPPGLG